MNMMDTQYRLVASYIGTVVGGFVTAVALLTALMGGYASALWIAVAFSLVTIVSAFVLTDSICESASGSEFTK